MTRHSESPRHRRPRIGADQSGFTIVEVLIASMILLIGVFATLRAFGAATANTQRAKETQILLDVAQQEMERVRSIPYSQIALSSLPADSTDPLNPDSRVTSTGGAFYLDRAGVGGGSAGSPNPATLVVNGGSLYGGGFVNCGTACLAPGSVVSAATAIGDVSVHIFRFVVWQNDPACTSCPGGQDYKRVVIAVRPDRRGNQTYQRGYVEVQSDFIDPARSALTDPQAGAQGVVTAQQFWLTDTPCAAGGSTAGLGVTGDHLLHNTLGTCASGAQTGTTAGAPDALLLHGPPDPAPDDPSIPAAYDYANDFYLEPSPDTDKGVQIKRQDANGCSYSPTGSNPESKIHRWVSDPLASSFTMTGNATLEFYTRAINDAVHTGKLCVYLFSRSETGTPPVATDTQIRDKVITSSNSCSPTCNPYFTYTPAGGGNWPRNAWTKVRFLLQFNSIMIPAGQRLGIAISVERAATPADSIQILYDHPNYPTRIEVDTSTPIDVP